MGKLRYVIFLGEVIFTKGFVESLENTIEDVKYTIDAFSKIVHKLKSGQYMADKIASV